MKNIVDNLQTAWARPLGDDRGLVDRIAEQIRGAIVEGNLPPGEKIREEALSEAFATSRTPVREALRMLEAEGLVTIIPRRGAWVSELVPREAADIHLCRAYLLGLACKLAAHRRTEEDMRELDALVARLRDFKERDMGPDYVAAAAAINDWIVNMAESTQIREALKPLNAKARRYRHVSGSLSWRREDAVRNYEKIAGAIRRRRPDEAEQLMRRTIAASAEALLRHILPGEVAQELMISGYLFEGQERPER